jgi:hypothetical protein
MKTIVTISACTLLALSTPAFAQSTSNFSSGKELQQNGSVNGPGAAHAKQKGSARAESGPSNGMTEGRAATTTNTPGDSANPAPKTDRGDQKQQDQAK